MLASYMLDGRFRDSQIITCRDFDHSDVYDFLREFDRAFSAGEIGLASLKAAMLLCIAAHDAVYAQAILQSTGAIEGL